MRAACPPLCAYWAPFSTSTWPRWSTDWSVFQTELFSFLLFFPPDFFFFGTCNVVFASFQVVVLGMFQRLVSTKKFDHEGFNLLRPVVYNVPTSVLILISGQNQYFEISQKALSNIKSEMNMDIPEGEESFLLMHLCVLFEKENIEKFKGELN